MNEPLPIPLLGCGVLAKELAFLIRKNRWPLHPDFLPSSLHVDLKALARELQGGLQRHGRESPIVFYGCCHPLMDRMLGSAGTFRVEAQNCVEALLGSQAFMDYLETGAYFLLEDWAVNWEAVMVRTFGRKWEVARAIFHEDRKFLLGIRTPCSGDFARFAENASLQIDLPLLWHDTTLDHLEALIESSLERWLSRQSRKAGPRSLQGFPQTRDRTSME